MPEKLLRAGKGWAAGLPKSLSSIRAYSRFVVTCKWLRENRLFIFQSLCGRICFGLKLDPVRNIKVPHYKWAFLTGLTNILMRVKMG